MASHHFSKICLITHSQYTVEISEILQWNYTNFYKGLFKNDVNVKIAFCGLFSPACHNLSLFSLTLLPPCHRPKTNRLYFRKSNYKKLNQKHVVEEINYSSFIVDILRGHGVEDQQRLSQINLLSMVFSQHHVYWYNLKTFLGGNTILCEDPSPHCPIFVTNLGTPFPAPPVTSFFNCLQARKPKVSVSSPVQSLSLLSC